MLAEPADRELAIVSVRWEPEVTPVLPAAPEPHRLLFDRCVFFRGQDLDDGDSVVGVETSGVGGSVVVRQPSLGDGVEPLSPSCGGCSVDP
jgi:hypothetical protein